ncbi:MAG: universal stress protein [Desulfobacteraceae bacterium]|nr:universal stress protein [Desulfobacteraceae bacterium]
MFSDILAATDLVQVADPVVAAAARLAEQFRVKLHILHVLESGDTQNRRKVRHYITGQDMETNEAYEKQVADEIRAVYSPIVHSSVGGDIRVVPGFPWEEILSWSRLLASGLIVMGPHSARAAEKGVIRVAGKIGSTVEGVVTRENCPVVIVNPLVQLEAAEFRCILVGVDFSVSCECALSFAVQLARRFQGRVVVFHMIPVPPWPKYSRENYEADLAATRQRLTEFCEPFFDGLPHEYAIWGGGLPHQEILSCAAKTQADLIVLGSHTKESQGKWYAGSVVERTSFRAACPVAVITDPKALMPWDGEKRPDPEIDREKDRNIHVFNKGQQTP